MCLGFNKNWEFECGLKIKNVYNRKKKIKLFYMILYGFFSNEKFKTTWEFNTQLKI